MCVEKPKRLGYDINYRKDNSQWLPRLNSFIFIQMKNPECIFTTKEMVKRLNFG